MKRRIVFCDFDGTITAEESLEAAFNRFLPGRWPPMKERLLSGKITLREAVRKMLESIPTSDYPKILEFVKTIPVRPGLESLLDFLDAHKIPFIIVSGGLRGMVDSRLGQLIQRAKAVIAVDVDTGGEYLSVRSQYEGGTELVAKADVLCAYDADERIVIGDGFTDLNMAKVADLIFARDSLAGFLDRMGIAFRQWSDFFDIRDQLNDWINRV